jgi:putative hemolysin
MISDIIICVFCLFLSFVLSGMESGLLSLSPIRIRRLMNDGNKNARVLFEYLENYERFLWTIIVGNSIALFVIMALGSWRILNSTDGWLMKIFGYWFPLLGIVYFLGDLLPKILFHKYPNRLTLAMTRPFQIVDFFLKPIVWLVAAIAREFGLITC